MHAPDPDLAQTVLRYVTDRMQLDPAPLGRLGDATELQAGLKGLLGADGHAPAEVLARYAEHIEPTVVSCDSPRFLAFIPGAPTKAAALFDMVVSAASLHGVSWMEASGAIEAENQTLRLLADLAGMPAQAGGCFVSGGSAGNLSALVVARDSARARLGLGSRDPLRIAVSDQTHSSVANTLRIIGVDPLIVPTDDHRLTGAALRAALAADAPSAAELGPVIGVVGTAGTTNAGIVDDLAGLAEAAAEHCLWFHVDAAYGGGGLFVPEVRARMAGVERADSLVIDPHKWLFAPFDCGALLYREPGRARVVHTQDASYLDAIHAEHEGEWNPSDYAYHLTRRPRGLPLWFSLAVHGTDAYRDAVEQGLRMARFTAELARETPGLELVREPELSVVLIRRSGWDAAEHNAWCARLLAAGAGFLAPTNWEGETVARLAFIHPGITEQDVRDIIASLAEPAPASAPAL